MKTLEEIKKWMADTGRNGPDLAKELGFSRGYVWNILSGKAPLADRFLNRLNLHLAEERKAIKFSVPEECAEKIRRLAAECHTTIDYMVERILSDLLGVPEDEDGMEELEAAEDDETK